VDDKAEKPNACEIFCKGCQSTMEIEQVGWGAQIMGKNPVTGLRVMLKCPKCKDTRELVVKIIIDIEEKHK